MSQLLKKFIGADQVDETKIRLNNNSNLRARNAANSADVGILKLNASNRIEFISVPQITSDAVAANDVVRYSQLAALSDGLKPKAAVRVASTANGTLATAFANGQVVDGVTLVTGDRILLWQQTAAEENGIYTVNASGAPTRASDFDAPSEIPGAYTVAAFGTLYQGVLFVSLSSPGTIGVDPINFAMRSVTGGANTSLSNLAATAVNVDLKPAGDEGIALGGIGNRWSTGYIGNLADQSGNLQIDLDNRTLVASDGSTSMIQWQNEAVGVMIGRDLLPVQDAVNSIGGASNRWVNLTLSGAIYDGSAQKSIDVGLRKLYDVNGAEVADYSTISGGSNGAGMFQLKKEIEFSTGAANAYIRTRDGVVPEGLILESGNVVGSSSGDMYFRSGSADTSTTGTLYITSGDASAADIPTGNVNLMTGAATGTGVSGTVQLVTGTTVDGNSGDINILIGQPSGTGLRGKVVVDTRQLWIHGGAADQGLEQILLGVDGGQPSETGFGIITHDASAGNTSDGMYIASGSGAAAGSSSGGINISTGAGDQNTGQLTFVTGNAVVGASGPMSFTTGQGGTSNGSGAITMATGPAQGGQTVGNFSISTGASVDGQSGVISLVTGAATGTTGISGDISLTTGTSIDGNSGNVFIATGIPSGTGTRGSMTIDAFSVAISSGPLFMQSAPIYNYAVSSGFSSIVGPSNGGQYYENNFGKLMVYTGTGANSGWGEAGPFEWVAETFVLSGTDITNQYVDLAHYARQTIIQVNGANGIMLEGASYDYSAGDSGSGTRVNFLNNYATGGLSALVAGDVMQVKYVW